MEFESVYHLFGVRIHLATNSDRVREEAQLFLGAHADSSGESVDFRLLIEEADPLPDFGEPELQPCRGQAHQLLERGDRLFISVAEGVAWYDSQQRTGHGFVHPKVNERYPVATAPLINLLVIRIMFQAGFLPLHAAAVSWQEGLLVLFGEKGAGKSTLAVRLHQRGFPLICDDLLYLTQADHSLLAGGHCQPIKLITADASTLLADGAGAPSRAGVAGKSLFPTAQFRSDHLNRLGPVKAILCLQSATTRGAVAGIWRDREPEVLYHLLGDAPMLNTSAYRGRALELLSATDRCQLFLAQTSYDVDHTIQTILRTLA